MNFSFFSVKVFYNNVTSFIITITEISITDPVTSNLKTGR